ncbi:MAG: MinD/ParA family protein [Alphaproteobacteria bacterium]|nr:MinD/ParA family protein [Alphaproteobacteria bacterium]
MATIAAVDTAPIPGWGRNIIAVASGKGGVGKTWFAISLAHALSKLGQNALLFDGDIGLANVDIQLGLMPERDIASVIAGKLTLKQSVTHIDEGGFDVIAGRSGSGSLAALPAPRLSALRDQIGALSGAYDRVIVDLGAGIDRTVRTLTAPEGICLVVATDEPTSLTDAYAFIKVTAAERPGADLRILVNMAASRTDGINTYETLLKACRGFLQLEPPLAGIIRHDAKVRESIRLQVPLLTRYPNSDAASDVERVARALLATP